jgi:hypothetical protein
MRQPIGTLNEGKIMIQATERIAVHNPHSQCGEAEEEMKETMAILTEFMQTTHDGIPDSSATYYRMAIEIKHLRRIVAWAEHKYEELCVRGCQ